MQTTVTATGDGELLVEDVLGRHSAKQIDTLLFEDEAGSCLPSRRIAIIRSII